MLGIIIPKIGIIIGLVAYIYKIWDETRFILYWLNG